VWPKVTLPSTDRNRLVVRKTADETVNNSTTLQDDDALKVPVPANSVWHIHCAILYNSGGTPDIKFSLSVPTGATYMLGIVRGDAASQINWQASASGALAADGQGADYFLLLEAIVTVGATAGNAVVQWAQNMADASDTKVLKNSCLIATRLF